MLDVTKQVWQMLMDDKSTDEILKVCSVSSLCKIRAEFNKQKKRGELSDKPSRFPQKPRGKNQDDVILSSKGEKRIAKTEVLNKNEKLPPSNYPQPGKPDIKIQENFEKGEKSFDVKSYEINTLEDLIKWTKIDMSKFDCASFTANRWGNERWECTQCKAVFKPKVRSGITPEECAEVFEEMVKKYKPIVYEPPKKSIFESGNIAESIAMDVHFGSLTRLEETGIDYNLKISSNDVLESAVFHLEFMKTFNPEKIIIPVGSDFFNVDSVNNTTTRGTFQSEDSTWKHTFKKGCMLMVLSIDLHKQVAPVEIKIIPGNHDKQRSFSLGMFLMAWYKDDPLVEIDNSESIRKYFRWGTTLIGLTHGEERSRVNYLALMSNEAREDVGKTIFREMHTGHLHHQQIIEDVGFRIRRFGGLTAKDAWHSEKGYDSIRESQCLIINDKRGIIASSNFHPEKPI